MQKRSNDDGDDHESSKRARFSDELAIRPDTSNKITVTSEGVKRTSNLSAPTILLEGHTGAVYSVAFDSTGQNLASASFDRQICKCLYSTNSIDSTMSTIYLMSPVSICSALGRVWRKLELQRAYWT